MHFGRVDAETDYRLDSCFVGTEMLRHALLPQHGLFIGPKGSGKSALFRLLCGDMRAWKPLLPKGFHSIFRVPITGIQSERYLSGVNLNEFSPNSANDFRAFWLLYIGLKIGTIIVEDRSMQEMVEKSQNKKVRDSFDTLLRVVGALGLADVMKPVDRLRQRIEELVRPMREVPESDPSDIGKQISIGFRNKTGIAIITLLDTVDVLLQETKTAAWVLMDKLDLLYFDDFERLQASVTGLVQLLVEYSNRFRNIHFKVFLRRDIYRQLRIVNKSHLVSYSNEMQWKGSWLIKLLVARAISDQKVREYCEAALGREIDVAAVINGSDEFVLDVFYTIFEDHVANGVAKRYSKRNTHEWILKRVVDGLGMGFPREVIHLGNSAAKRQRSLDRDQGSHTCKRLISSKALKQAFDAVSAYRCETYLDAEFPHLSNHIDRLRGRPAASIGREELRDLYDEMSPSGDEAIRSLHDIGLLAPGGGSVDSARRFEIPLLYRSGLGILQRRKKKSEPEQQTPEPEEHLQGREDREISSDNVSSITDPIPPPSEEPEEEANIPSPQFVS